MMSISAVSSSGQASSYYEVDDYYTKDNADGHTNLSEWVGKGAVLQGLEGSVSPDDFKRVLDGVTPDGAQLGRVVKGEIQHRAGLDLTFTPPKSVAIMAQVFGDERIKELHKEAVKETLSMVEAYAAKARIATGGVTALEDTKNLTAAMFQHTSTRAQDPGMHSHVVIANMTLCSDGKWRSLFNDAIWENSKARFGEHYSMALAHKLHENGYDIISRGKNAEYEIAGVPKELIDHFSTRGQQIAKLLEERGLSGPKNREWATLATREKKVPMDKELEEATWKERALHLGYDLSGLVDKAKDNAGYAKADMKHEIAITGVKDAVEQLSQRTTAFSLQEVVQITRNLVIGKVEDKDIHRAVSHLKEQEFILQPKNSDLITSRDTIAAETDNLMRVEFGKNIFSPIASNNEISQVSHKYTLNHGQAVSLSLGLTTKDRVSTVQGWAGVGKTHFARALNEIVESKGYEVIGLSPSAQAASQLESDSGIKSNTVASFIFRNADRLDPSREHLLKQESAENIRNGTEQRKFIVIDESSFVSTQDFNKLIRIAESYDARVLKMGDKKQLGAVDAGAPHKQLLDNGVSSSNMTDIVRQQNNPELRNAIYDAIDGNVSKAMSGVTVRENPYAMEQYQKAKLDSDHRVSYAELRSALATQAAERYLSLTPMERSNTALVVQNNDVRVQTNQMIRDGLIAQNAVDTKSITVPSLKNVGLTDSEFRYAHNYEIGNLVRFNTESSHFNITPNEYYEVKHNDTLLGGERFLTLSSEKDPERQIVIHPRELASRGERAVEVFKRSDRELAAGDDVRWTRNDKPRAMVNTQTATVLSVDQATNEAQMLLSNGETQVLKMDELQNSHFDYNFANTAHAVQGATVERSIMVVESWHRLLTNMKSFYVGISRAKVEAEVITDSVERTIEALENNTQREDIGLDLYEPGNQPLDFDLLKDMADQIQNEVSVKDLYSDLVDAFNGDKLSAQRHLNELGLDGAKIDAAVVIDNVIADLQRAEEIEVEFSEREGSHSDSAHHDYGEFDDGNSNEKLDDAINEHQGSTEGQADWVNFDEIDSTNSAAELEKQQEEQDRLRDMDMDM